MTHMNKNKDNPHNTLVSNQVSPDTLVETTLSPQEANRSMETRPGIMPKEVLACSINSILVNPARKEATPERPRACRTICQLRGLQ